MPITTGWKNVPWRSIIVVVLLSTAAFAGLIGLTSWLNSTSFGNTTVDHTEHWDAYYKDTISRYFVIPEEAEIVSATETGQMLGQKDEVTFRLPGTKSPEEWLAEIAEASALTEYRQHKHAYDAGQTASEKRGLDKKGDTFRLSYDEHSGEYHAVYAWD